MVGALLDLKAKNPSCALVLGGYVNGYSIIKELSACGVTDIWLFDYGGSLSRYSNKVTGIKTIQRTAQSLREEIEALHSRYDFIVVYPTDDLQLELLVSLYDHISSYCFLPFNRLTLLSAIRKDVQYDACKKLGVPYPASCVLRSQSDYKDIDTLTYPLLLKPLKRDDLTQEVFRNLYIDSYESLIANKDLLDKCMLSGVPLLVSEFIPGDASHIYAYVAYRSHNGQVLNEWIGKKLSQHPDDFGVFSSAANNAPEVVRSYGYKLLQELNLYGICEPEFKYDERDGTYKLMEINLRSMMWHRLGNLSGVFLHYSQWLDAHGLNVPFQTQDTDLDIHFVYMKHEMSNLLRRENYIKVFFRNIFCRNHIGFAVYDSSDIKPFLYDSVFTLKGILMRCLKI